MALDPKKAQEYAKANKAAAEATKENAENAKELRDRLRDVLSDTRDFASDAKEAAKQVFRSGIAASETAKAFRDVASAAKGITDNYAEVLTGEKDFQSLLKDRERLLKAQNSFNTEYEQFLKEVIDDQETINGILAGTIDPYEALDANLDNVTEDAFRLLELYQEQNDQLAQEADNMEEIAKRAGVIDSAMRPLGDKAIGLQDMAKGLSDGLNKAGLGDLGGKLGIDDALKGTREMASNLTEGGTKALDFGGKLNLAKGFAKTLGGNLLKALSPVALIAKSIQEIVKAFNLIDKQSGEVAKNFGISYKEANKLVSASADAAAMSGDNLVNTEGVVAAQTALNKQFGTSVQFAGDFAAEFASIQKRTQLSGEAMGFFASQAQVTGGSMKDQLNSIAGVTQELNHQNGIVLNQKDIQESIAKTSKANLLTAGRNTKELANQVFQSKLLGVSQSQLEDMGNSLLNFEESIAAEMEAELLTGKQLNLEKARQAALEGDIATLASEIRKEVGTAAEFGEMNVIQQTAIAKAVGMTREEMAAALVEQENLAALQKAFGKDVTSMSQAQAEYNKLRAEGLSAEEAAAKLGDKNLANQLESTSQQEKLNAAMSKLTDLFVQIIDPLMPLVDTIMNILEPIFDILGPIFKLIGDISNVIMVTLQPALASLQAFFDGISGAMENVKEIFAGVGKVFQGIVTFDFSMVKEGLLDMGKGVIKLLIMPFQTVLDMAFAFLNTIIKGLNYVPFVDIPLIPEYSIAEDLIGLAEGGIVTSPTTALIGEGGEPEAVVPLSKANSMGFGGSNKETNTLLRELISLVKQGGDVTLDGQKVGQAMMLGSYQLQ